MCKHGYTINYRTETIGRKTIEVIDSIMDNVTGEILSSTCRFLNNPTDYENAGYIAVEPMSAKDPLNEEQQEEMLESLNTIAEEKFDGVRGTLHLKTIENRMFSRRISTKTDWYGDNSDRLPQFRDYVCPELDGTVIDGELVIPNVCFNDISGMLNMDWDKAIERQVEIGLCEFIVFDCIYYKGVYIAKMPLEKRKKYVEKVVRKLNHPLIKMGEYTYSLVEKPITETLIDMFDNQTEIFKETYPNLYRNYVKNKGITLLLNKHAWYEYVVMHGGEGLMLKDKSATYEHKRSRNFTKIKKFETWDVIITRFLEPTKEYNGKDASTWEYRDEFGNPVTKHYYMNWIGNVAFGVVITEQELAEWKKRNPKEKPITHVIDDQLILEVGDCAGFSEEIRSYMTTHQEELIGKVIEIKGHEVMKKTGKIRHPRFVRIRPDKGLNQCNLNDHLRNN